MEHFQEDENICLSSNCLHLCLHLLLYLYLQKLSGIPPCNLSARPPAQHLDEQEVAGKWSQVSKLFRCFFPKLNLLLLVLQYFEILQKPSVKKNSFTVESGVQQVLMFFSSKTQSFVDDILEAFEICHSIEDKY